MPPLGIGEELRQGITYPSKRAVRLRTTDYYMVHEREEGTYPTREEFYVVAPAFMDDKLRGKPEKFDERWERVGNGLPMRPPKPEKKPRKLQPA